jgi:hypothetical protein
MEGRNPFGMKQRLDGKLGQIFKKFYLDVLFCKLPV